MKYIIIGYALPVIFQRGLNHRAVAGIMSATSAGFVDLSAVDGRIKANCHGESISLGLKSDPADAEIIEMFLNQ